jgi:hypothetical protein
MTVSSMGMFASGVFSFLACKVFKLTETVAGAQVGGRRLDLLLRFRTALTLGLLLVLPTPPHVLRRNPNPCIHPPPPQITPHYYGTHMLPVGFFMALTLWSGNKVYLYLTVSFIQMLKVGGGGNGWGGYTGVGGMGELGMIGRGVSRP